MLARQLTPVESWQKNIAERSVPHYLAALLKSQERDSLELSQRKRAVACLAAEIQQIDARPVRWCLTILWQRHRRIAMTCVLVAVLLVLLKFKHIA